MQFSSLSLIHIFNAGNTYKDYTVTLEKDLDLGGENWTPIGRSGHTFQGVFDGNGHTVSNLKVDMATSSDVGFFGFTQGGEIRNLTIHNAQVKGYLDVGVVDVYKRQGPGRPGRRRFRHGLLPSTEPKTVRNAAIQRPARCIPLFGRAVILS